MFPALFSGIHRQHALKEAEWSGDKQTWISVPILPYLLITFYVLGTLNIVLFF
jgi:hypothetical protein